jgi:very-long-chain enoyl-CoA reductase
MTLSPKQKVGCVMALLHYFKRELETCFVHRFSKETMPLKNLFWNSTGYWIIFGVGTMYFFLQPTDSERELTDFEKVIALFFGAFELLNLKTHLVLRNLRRQGTTERGIPRGFGFDQVSCANYFWELMCWVSFALFT